MICQIWENSYSGVKEDEIIRICLWRFSIDLYSYQLRKKINFMYVSSYIFVLEFVKLIFHRKWINFIKNSVLKSFQNFSSYCNGSVWIKSDIVNFRHYLLNLYCILKNFILRISCWFYCVNNDLFSSFTDTIHTISWAFYSLACFSLKNIQLT